MESKQVELAQREVGDVSELYASILRLNEKTKSFRERLPVSRRLGEFRNDLEHCLRNSGITYYRPQELQAMEVNPEKLPASLALAEGTTILPIKLSFGAKFSQVFEFLKRLESLERLAHVESMEIENSEEQAGQLSVQMIIHAYHRPEDR